MPANALPHVLAFLHNLHLYIPLQSFLLLKSSGRSFFAFHQICGTRYRLIRKGNKIFSKKNNRRLSAALKSVWFFSFFISQIFCDTFSGVSPVIIQFCKNGCRKSKHFRTKKDNRIRKKLQVQFSQKTCTHGAWIRGASL